MNKNLRFIGIATIFVIITISLSYIFFKKHYISYSAYYRLSFCQTEFYPLAYRFINSEQELIKLLALKDNGRNKETRIRSVLSSIDFDFNNHTYLIVYGAPVKDMYYSIKTTLFDDISPSYASARRYGKQCVFINYSLPTGYCYIYELEKNTDITGFDGC